MNLKTTTLATSYPPASIRRRLSTTLASATGGKFPVVCAVFSVAVISIPTMVAFGRLEASVKKLAKVVSNEVPGTLFSLKLSSMELNELTQQLSNFRQKFSEVRGRKNDRSSNKPSTVPKKNRVS
ncbi:hypothetical protein L6164_013793 [Bauhinia variegata]|uniref:Uncharacterized protein n=1 Tax=Bauhinia variegata TaxID=167791 RepID=A0ACB9NG79_BAUVA|nr:hypothetical protein L6164_013793 [Bauhinia variegata]